MLLRSRQFIIYVVFDFLNTIFIFNHKIAVTFKMNVENKKNDEISDLQYSIPHSYHLELQHTLYIVLIVHEHIISKLYYFIIKVNLKVVAYTNYKLKFVSSYIKIFMKNSSIYVPLCNFFFFYQKNDNDNNRIKIRSYLIFKKNTLSYITHALPDTYFITCIRSNIRVYIRRDGTRTLFEIREHTLYIKYIASSLRIQGMKNLYIRIKTLLLLLLPFFFLRIRYIRCV